MGSMRVSFDNCVMGLGMGGGEGEVVMAQTR